MTAKNEQRQKQKLFLFSDELEQKQL